MLTSVGDMRMEVFGSRVYHALEKVRGSSISDNVINFTTYYVTMLEGYLSLSYVLT